MTGGGRVALVVAYDGSRFFGWQRQDRSEHRTVQGDLESALGRLHGQPVSLHGASRTDAEVHARAQVAHAELPGRDRYPPDTLRYRLNGQLGKDLRVRAVIAVPAGFHARKAALRKDYEYRFHVSPVGDPFVERQVFHVTRPLDLAAMREAARSFVGTHDFAAMRSLGSSVESTVREVLRCELTGDAPDVRIVVEGTGFLRHQVRAMAGCLLEVGRGRRPPAWVAEVLEGRDRSRAAANLPGHGLTLVAVCYPAPLQALLDAALAREHAFPGAQP